MTDLRKPILKPLRPATLERHVKWENYISECHHPLLLFTTNDRSKCKNIFSFTELLSRVSFCLFFFFDAGVSFRENVCFIALSRGGYAVT